MKNYVTNRGPSLCLGHSYITLVDDKDSFLVSPNPFFLSTSTGPPLILMVVTPPR